MNLASAALHLKRKVAELETQLFNVSCRSRSDTDIISVTYDYTRLIRGGEGLGVNYSLCPTHNAQWVACKMSWTDSVYKYIYMWVYCVWRPIKETNWKRMGSVFKCSDFCGAWWYNDHIILLQTNKKKTRVARLWARCTLRTGPAWAPVVTLPEAAEALSHMADSCTTVPFSQQNTGRSVAQGSKRHTITYHQLEAGKPCMLMTNGCFSAERRGADCRRWPGPLFLTTLLDLFFFFFVLA